MNHALVGRKEFAKILAKIQLFYNCNGTTHTAILQFNKEENSGFHNTLFSDTLQNIQGNSSKPL